MLLAPCRLLRDQIVWVATVIITDLRRFCHKMHRCPRYMKGVWRSSRLGQRVWLVAAIITDLHRFRHKRRRGRWFRRGACRGSRLGLPVRVTLRCHECRSLVDELLPCLLLYTSERVCRQCLQGNIPAWTEKSSCALEQKASRSSLHSGGIDGWR